MSCLARTSAPDVAVIRSGILYADCVQSVVSYIVVWCCGILARHQHYSVIRLLTFGKRLVCCVRLFRVSACTTSLDQWDDAPRSPLSYCGIPFSCEYSRSFGNQWLQTNCSFVLDSSWREGDKLVSELVSRSNKCTTESRRRGRSWWASTNERRDCFSGGARSRGVIKLLRAAKKIGWNPSWLAEDVKEADQAKFSVSGL